MQHTNLPMHLTCPVNIIQQFMFVWLELDILFYYMWFLGYCMRFSDHLFTDLYWHWMFMCTYAHDTIFYTCFPIQIYRYTSTYLILFTNDSLIFIYVTGYCLYLYVWTTSLDHVLCNCLSMPTGFILRTRWVVFWQPWTFMSRSRSLNCSGLL